MAGSTYSRDSRGGAGGRTPGKNGGYTRPPISSRATKICQYMFGFSRYPSLNSVHSKVMAFTQDGVVEWYDSNAIYNK
ncbi:unnamed protein product [Sympodiomycopsis kandeliae]